MLKMYNLKLVLIMVVRLFYHNSFTGTVAASIADIDFVKRREGVEELFEDGTTSFLSIASIRHGFKILNSLTISSISEYVELASFVVCILLVLMKKMEVYVFV